MDTREKNIKESSSRFYGLTDLAEYPFITLDCYRFLCGDWIGSGAYRMVFEYYLQPSCVIKISYGESVKANQIEYAIWQAVKGTYYAKWFAPCLKLSPGGHFMVQKKCRPITDKDKLPKKIPDFFTDVKKGNFGFIGNQLVCHDYQFISRAIDISFNVNMRIVDWPVDF